MRALVIGLLIKITDCIGWFERDWDQEIVQCNSENKITKEGDCLDYPIDEKLVAQMMPYFKIIQAVYIISSMLLYIAVCKWPHLADYVFHLNSLDTAFLATTPI